MGSSSSAMPQYDSAYVPGNSWQPINELMRAIILRTVEDYNSGGELREEAIIYMTDEDEEYIFSFRSICKHMGMDPVKTYFRIANAKHRISTRRRAA